MDANAEYVKKLRVNETTTNEEIQAALYKLFKSSPQGGANSQGPQGQSILTEYPQATIISTNGDASPQGLTTRHSVIAATGIFKTQLYNELKNY